MASVVDICNLSLAHLGDDATVSSINPPEGSAQAEHCQRFYPIARDALLEMHPWGFSTSRIALTPTTDTPPDSWTFAYSMPNDCLKAVTLYSPALLSGFEFLDLDFWNPNGWPWAPVSTDAVSQDFVVETNGTGTVLIYTNIENANLLYARRVQDTTKFSPTFVLALARLLSSYLAGPVIKGDSGIQQAMNQRKMFEQVEFPAAKSNDAQGRQYNPYTSAIPPSIAARR